MYKATRQLTLNLVAMPSINGTLGESAVVEYLHHRLAQNAAYRSGRMRLFLIPSPADTLGRPVLVAHTLGQGESRHEIGPAARNGHASGSKRTKRGVLVFGHIDTVGTDDFGILEALAFRPQELTEKIKEGALGRAAQEQARSGKWLYGRGILDMKSGIAAALVSFEAPEDEQISLQAVINTDYTTSQPGDGGTRHIYLGSIGKLLPAVYVRGVPSHAAEPEHGIDPNAIVAAITNQVVYNPLLRDTDAGETSPFPVCLYQRDDKESYNVQTAVSASAYYNLFHMNRSPREQLESFTSTVRKAVADVQEAHSDVISADIPVITFSQLRTEVSDAVWQEVLAYADSLAFGHGLQERCRLVVEFLLRQSSRTGPCVVVSQTV